MLIFRVCPYSSHMSLRLLRDQGIGRISDTHLTVKDIYDTVGRGFYVGRGRFEGICYVLALRNT